VAYGYLWFPGVDESVSSQIFGFAFTLNIKLIAEAFSPAIHSTIPVKVTVGSELAFLISCIQELAHVRANVWVVIRNIVFSANTVVQSRSDASPAV
jgi:hypothetical protein